MAVSCFPKDVSAFHSVAMQCGIHFGLLAEVTRINLEQRHNFVKENSHCPMDAPRQAHWQFLGLAFKGGTDYIRESPAIAIIQELLKGGASICAYDPAATPKAREVPAAGRPSNMRTTNTRPPPGATLCW